MAILLGEETVTVERYTGAFVLGEWTPVLDSTFDVKLSVQPISGTTQQRLAEGYRTEATHKGYGQPAPSPRLRTTSEALGTSNDIVIYKSNRLDVIAVEDWDVGHAATSHVRYQLAELGADGNV